MSESTKLKENRWRVAEFTKLAYVFKKLNSLWTNDRREFRIIDIQQSRILEELIKGDLVLSVHRSDTNISKYFQEYQRKMLAQVQPVVQDKDKDKEKDTYSEIISKRLRTLKKRIAKIERYETMDQSTLNQDQVQALQKKPEVVYLIQELEEIKTIIANQEAEDKKNEKKQRKAQNVENSQRISQAVKDATEKEALKFVTLARLTVAVTSVLPNIPLTVVQKVDKSYLVDLYNQLLMPSGTVGEDLDNVVQSKVELLDGLTQDDNLKVQLQGLFDFVKDLSQPAQAPVPVVEKKFEKMSFMTDSAVQLEPVAEEFQDPAILSFKPKNNNRKRNYGNKRKPSEVVN